MIKTIPLNSEHRFSLLQVGDYLACEWRRDVSETIGKRIIRSRFGTYQIKKIQHDSMKEGMHVVITEDLPARKWDFRFNGGVKIK